MARSYKIGLDYFPHACVLDENLRYIIAVHKEVGYYVYFRILENIYSNNGYYINWDKRYIALLSEGILVDINKINEIINDCLCEELFDLCIQKRYNILTSRGIQKRYFEAISRRCTKCIHREYNLLDNDYISKLNVTFTSINVNKSTQRKEKKRKVNLERSLESFEKFWEDYDKKIGDPELVKKLWEDLSHDTKIEIMEYIPKYKLSRPDKKFRKDPENFLLKSGWKDELIFEEKKKIKITDETEKSFIEQLNLQTTTIKV